MSYSSYVFIFKTKMYRLGSRFLLCLLCFIIGCTITASLISTLECPKPTSGKVALPEKMQSLDNKVNKKILVILILSAPDNVVKRHALRRTWLSLTDQETVKYYFAVGSKTLVGDKEETLLTEERHYSDMLILPEVEEGYNLLTTKLLASFSWIDKYIDFDFLLKVDDDSYVDIRQLLRELVRKENGKRLYWGYFSGHARVQQKGKWTERKWNLCDHYLPYARGGGYILSRELVHYLAQNANYLNFYKNEDVAVGTWLAPVNTTRDHDIRFDTEWASRGCSNQYLITHPHDVADIYKLHESLSNNGHLCKLEFQKRPAYSYDWDVLPSQCCKNLT
ncbi:hypothetical protein ONE63_007235 [Megalurothrips usitatus]|uniref:Hexosyltransferase n=1 Tax=Megalurothrips usitatus TaxID=439358 RepID=A0AAV7XUU5_9NEOP|nr:hypothetical protein ONE63_007235 [Megalurothrips usitatus]